MKGGKVRRYFPDSDMRMSHDGLTEHAKKEGFDLSSLRPGQYVVFFNKDRTHLKLAGAYGTITSKRSEHGRFFDLTCINEVVESFNNTGKIDYDAALEKKLHELLARKHARKEQEKDGSN